MKPMASATPPPLNTVINVTAIQRRVKAMDLDELLNFLNTRDVIAWPLRFSSINLFVVKDFETRHGRSVWPSQLGMYDPIAMFFNINHSVKIYSEADLRRIALGFIAHDLYQGVLRLAVPEVESEVRFIDTTLGIAGVADLVVGDSVVEIKTGKKSPKHVLQLAAYLRGLGKSRGFIVYPDEVIEINYGSELERKLIEAVNKLRNLMNVVSAHDLDSLVKRFRRSYKRFKQRLGADPKDLVKVLEKEGFI